MRLTEGVTAGNQSHRFLVIHGHAGKGGADISGGSDRVWNAVGALRVHVDQSHVYGRQWLLQVSCVDIAVTFLRFITIHHAVTLHTLLSFRVTNIIAQPCCLASPVYGLVRLPLIGTATSETKRLHAHGFESDVTSKQDQIRPGDLVAILLFDGP